MRALEESPPGCWVLKGDPKVWRYFQFLQDAQVRVGKPTAGNWTLQGNYRADMMKKNDLVVLWITGEMNPGIYEIGRITGPVRPVSGMEPRYVADPDKARNANFSVPFRTVLLAPPVARYELQDRKTLAACEQFHTPQGPNPSYLTLKETKLLARMLSGRVPDAVLDELGWASETLKP